ncbi:hypothetical protein CEK25_000143 [Fusarium fujikuroi]|nr:hypothetical protein CEK25_000143 [Fusarium fujikuroi]
MHPFLSEIVVWELAYAYCHQLRNQIRYIWFRVELKYYDCTQCENNNQDQEGLDEVDNQFIVDAFENLFTTLSAWEPRGDLVLDISIYSPSDNQHWFKYLSFSSDTSTGEPSHHGHEHGSTMTNDPAHGWVAGRCVIAPSEDSIDLTFDEIMGEGPFYDDETEMQWWRSLPSVPVVGVLVIFENDNESYAETYRAPAVRVPSQDVSLKLARTSHHLEILSASFMADASHFFAVPQIQDSWTWGKLASLALTSNVLTGDADPLDVNRMLQNAAAAAFKMPKLNIMELWNGRKGLEKAGSQLPLRYRGHQSLPLGIQLWKLGIWLLTGHCHSKVVIQTSSIDPNAIQSHGDAICQLGLLTEVTRPVSLWQIINGNRSRARDHHQ